MQNFGNIQEEEPYLNESFAPRTIHPNQQQSRETDAHSQNFFLPISDQNLTRTEPTKNLELNGFTVPKPSLINPSHNNVYLNDNTNHAHRLRPVLTHSTYRTTEPYLNDLPRQIPFKHNEQGNSKTKSSIQENMPKHSKRQTFNKCEKGGEIKSQETFGKQAYLK